VVEEADGSVGLVLSADRVPNLVPIEKSAATPPSSPQNGAVPSSLPKHM
jgi:hypothetical protein